MNAQDNWQPIESAPRNSHRVLLTDGSLVWSGAPHSKQRDARDPTHWQPLPKPPKPTKVKTFGTKHITARRIASETWILESNYQMAFHELKDFAQEIIRVDREGLI